MAARHMDILNQWRHEVVRGDGTQKVYMSEVTGEEYPKSLTGTCMQCHGRDTRINETVTCAECHDYANVKPRCWDCHLDEKGS